MFKIQLRLFSMVNINLVPRVSHPTALERGDERPWERGWVNIVCTDRGFNCLKLYPNSIVIDLLQDVI